MNGVLMQMYLRWFAIPEASDFGGCNLSYASSEILLGMLTIVNACRYYDKFLTRCQERASANGWDPPLVGRSPRLLCCFHAIMDGVQ